jgi:hypothetical protein
MEWGNPHKLLLNIFIAKACTDMSGFDPTANGTGITLNRSGSRNFLAHQGPGFTNPYTCPTVRATLTNDRLFLYQANSIHRAIPDTEPAPDTFFKDYYHMAPNTGLLDK